MRIERIRDVEEFLLISSDFRSRHSLLTNIVASVALSVAGGRTYDAYFYWVLLDGEDVVGVALRTAPWNLVVSPMPDEAAELLGATVVAADPDLPGVNGPRQEVEAVYRGMQRLRKLQPRVHMTDVLYELAEYVPPPQIRGSARCATESDIPLLIAWHIQFALDADVPVRDVERFVPVRVAAAGLWLWEVEGEPRAMAGHADPVVAPTGTVGRIGPVYTPAEYRGRRYATAITAHIVEILQPVCSIIMLYADMANPASNAVYRRLGFRQVAEVVETYLEPDHPAASDS
ncbi:MAG: GNAT family N-acetyltransferase [Actinomycetes bacterium]